MTLAAVGAAQPWPWRPPVDRGSRSAARSTCSPDPNRRCRASAATATARAPCGGHTFSAQRKLRCAPAHGIPTGRSGTSPPLPSTRGWVGLRPPVHTPRRLAVGQRQRLACVFHCARTEVVHASKAAGRHFNGPPQAKKSFGYPMNWRPAVAEASVTSLAAASVGHRAPVNASHLFTL